MKKKKNVERELKEYLRILMLIEKKGGKNG